MSESKYQLNALLDFHYRHGFRFTWDGMSTGCEICDNLHPTLKSMFMRVALDKTVFGQEIPGIVKTVVKMEVLDGRTVP